MVVMDKMVFSSLIAVNGMLTSHLNNLSTHHYYLTYHPCFDMQFCYCQTMQKYFRTVAMSSRKKQKRSSCPFVPRRAVRRKKRNCFDIDKDWADKLAASDKGSYYTQYEFEVVVPGNCVHGGNFVALFISADHVDQKAICIVSYPVYYHSYLQSLPYCWHTNTLFELPSRSHPFNVVYKP